MNTDTNVNQNETDFDHWFKNNLGFSSRFHIQLDRGQITLERIRGLIQEAYEMGRQSNLSLYEVVVASEPLTQLRKEYQTTISPDHPERILLNLEYGGTMSASEVYRKFVDSGFTQKFETAILKAGFKQVEIQPLNSHYETGICGIYILATQKTSD